MVDEREDRIRERAYAIWEREGRPEGRHEDHWRQASQDMPDDEAGRQRQGGIMGGGSGQQQGGMPDDASARAPGGLSSGLQPGGTIPAGGQGMGVGSIGTGGGSTGGSPTGTMGRTDS